MLFVHFWSTHPALLYALAVLLGLNFAFDPSPWMGFPCVIVVAPLLLQDARRGILACVLMGFSWGMGALHYQFPELPVEGTPGEGYFSITSKTTQDHFGKKTIYNGTLKTFKSEDGLIKGKKIPIAITIPSGHTLPSTHHTYRIQGTLKRASPTLYRFSVKRSTPWHVVGTSWNLASLRFTIKQKVKAYLSNHIPNPRSAAFLSGIATGDFEDRIMAHELGRFGLQHIMAISGFHFAIVAAFLSALLRSFIPRRIASLLLILLMSSYFLFLGCTPSIMRAWVMTTIILASFLFEKRYCTLNALGIAMLAILIYDPLMSRHIGFQFSTLTTAAILLFYGGVEDFFYRFFPPRGFGQVVRMDRLNQHGYLLLITLQQATALTIAVNLAALPIMLFYFQTFPLLSLLYNLFFPFMVSVSILLLLVATLIAPLTPIIHTLNSAYTAFMLNFAYNMPHSVDISLRVPSVPAPLLILYYCLLFSGGIYLHDWLREKKQERQDLVFL